MSQYFLKILYMICKELIDEVVDNLLIPPEALWYVIGLQRETKHCLGSKLLE